MLIDTHAHLDFPDFEKDIDDVIARAQQAGVERIITIGTTIEGCEQAIALAEKYSPMVFASVGIHPNEAEEVEDDWIDKLEKLARHPRVVAIGECGLDYYRPPVPDPAASATAALGASSTESVTDTLRIMQWKEKQAYVFRMQLDLAAQLNMNVIVHQRSSWEDCLAILDDAAPQTRAVFHCFGGSESQAQELFERNHLISFTGIVTFKNAESVREASAKVPLDKFMVETDCPYLAPVPHRGGRCEPAHVADVARAIAEARGISERDIHQATAATAESFFRFQK